MRILILCGSLEPGRDGVGDYARTLAESLLRQGHSCALVALNDPFCLNIVEGAGDIPSLRLPVDTSLDVPAVSAFRDRFAPDWISLQLVAYGLHPKGLLYGVIPKLRKIVAGTPLHLMMHELWLGNDRSPSWRHRLIGFFQRDSLGKLISVLRPRLVETTNPVYAALLRTIGVRAEILPLFGNIPVVAGAVPPEILAKAGFASGARGEWWLGLFFGGLHPEWKPEPFLGILSRAAQQERKRVCLVLAGNAGGDGERIWNGLARDYAGSFHFLRLGAQPANVVSALMQSADFGVAASPWSIIGKSGSVAAMLEHGLPVIVTRDDFQPRVAVTLPPSTDPLLHRCDETLEAKLAAGLPRRHPCARADEIAGLMAGRLAAMVKSSLPANEVVA
jgi:glycosyltransferase involved in cell wall biosynthesis